jgi:protocatechuate 3,4-dioxygenase beta subunit
MLSSCAACRAWAEQDEGPYHRDAQPVRRDIVEDRAGAALQLGVRLTHEDGSPATDATVEVWQCDALGRYSGFPPPDDSTVVTAATAPLAQYLPEDTFLRGSQPTDAAGMVEFRTIYPGWYPGRTVHIHLIVRVDERVLTGQLYFPEPISDEVLARSPYAARPGRDTTNASDTILPTGGAPAVLDIQAVGKGYRGGVCLMLPSAS